MKTLQAVRGMHDILPEESAGWQWLELILKTHFEAYGYREIRTPLVEQTELFTKAMGQTTDVVEKEMYALQERGDDQLSLRPEGTAGVVRAVLQHGLLNPPGLKTWYCGPMFRYERPQKGRQRQFYQAGLEVFGIEAPSIDAELIALISRIWRELNIHQHVELQINSLGDREDRERYRQSLIDYLTPFRDQLDEDSQRRLDANPLRIFDSKNDTTQAIMQHAPKLTEVLGAEARAHFKQLCACLDALEIKYTINPGLVRGLDYYGRTVFEWKTDQLGAQGTICAGGRYDDLIEMQGGRATPGIGLAMGMERLLELIQGQSRGYASVPDAYLVSAVGADQTLAIAERLRTDWADLRLIADLQGGSFKAQFKRADRSAALWALVLGADELAQGAITVKDLRGNAAQITLDMDQAAHWLEQNRS